MLYGPGYPNSQPNSQNPSPDDSDGLPPSNTPDDQVGFPSPAMNPVLGVGEDTGDLVSDDMNTELPTTRPKSTETAAANAASKTWSPIDRMLKTKKPPKSTLNTLNTLPSIGEDTVAGDENDSNGDGKTTSTSC